MCNLVVQERNNGSLEVSSGSPLPLCHPLLRQRHSGARIRFSPGSVSSGSGTLERKKKSSGFATYKLYDLG